MPTTTLVTLCVTFVSSIVMLLVILFVSDCGEYIQNFEYSNILLTFDRINFSYTKIFGHLFMSVLECKK